MKSSSASRKNSARKPSHFGSKSHPSPSGKAWAGLASIGRTGGLTARCTTAFLEDINCVVGGHHRGCANELIGHSTQLRNILMVASYRKCGMICSVNNFM